MKLYTYDFETLSWDWICVFKDFATKQYHVFHNDNDAFAGFLSPDAVYIGYNTKSYDQFIAKGVCCGFDNQQLKQLNDYLIAGGLGWQYPLLRDQFFTFNNADVCDDAQKNKGKDGKMIPAQSLKEIEGHLGMNITECSIPFDIDRPLTEEELAELIRYCKADVDATEKIVELRSDYFKNKILVGKMAGLSEAKAMSLTNAKLTATALRAKAIPHDDERCYVYPENLDRRYIPQEVFDFFDRMYDPSISDEDYFGSSHEMMIGDCEVKLAFGGIHGAVRNYFFGGGESQ